MKRSTVILVAAFYVFVGFFEPAHAAKGRVSVPFTYVVMGDPQWPWWPYAPLPAACDNGQQMFDTNLNYLVKDDCNDSGDMIAKWNSDTKTCSWKWPASEQECAADVENQDRIDAIKTLTQVTWPHTGKFVKRPGAVVINGDLTSYFHDDELEAYEEFYVDGLSNYAVLPGLGNHDYENNIWDCGLFNDCYVNAINFAREYITGARLSNFPAYWVDAYHPDSMAYSWSYGHYKFIQTHNYPDYNVDPLLVGNDAIYKSWDWVMDQIEQADEDGKYVVLNMHDYSSFTSSQKDDLEGTPVVLVFAAHELYKLGETDEVNTGDYIYNKFGDRIPVWHSGHSGSDQNYPGYTVFNNLYETYHDKILLAEFGEQSVTIAALDTRGGSASFDDDTIGSTLYQTYNFSQPSDHQLVPPVQGFVVVGVPNEDVQTAGGERDDAGQVNITYWNDLGNLSATQWSQGNLANTAVEADDEHGGAVAIGDFNGDLYLDLAAAAPRDDINSNSTDNGGLVSIVYGTDNGLTGTIELILQGDLNESEEDQDRFAEALAVGDFNGDGFDDLAFGAPHEDINCDGEGDDSDGDNAGAVWVVYGSDSGLDPGDRKRFIPGGEFGSCEKDDRFGWSLAVGNFDGDSYDDLAIGSIGEDLNNNSENDAGQVWVVYGSSSGLTDSGRDNINQEAINGTTFMEDEDEYLDQFGWALAAGDFNADDYDDLAVGVPYEDVNCDDSGSGSDHDDDGDGDNAGKFVIIYGTSSGLSSSGAQDFDARDFDNNSCEADDRIGYALAAGDFNNDGDDDLAIGAPGEDLQNENDEKTNDAGNVIYMRGSTSGLSPSNSSNINQGGQNTPGRNEANDHFGQALAAGDADLDGYEDLAIAVPDEDIGSTSNAGAVYVLLGSGSGLDFESNVVYLSNETPEEVVSDGVEGEDKFGLRLAMSPVIRDTTPPEVTVPDEITVEATKPEGADVSFEASAHDDFDGDLPVSCAPESGDTFALGQTYVFCTATDAAGNKGGGGFFVIVEDTTPPELTVPDDITVTADKPEGRDVSWQIDDATDLVDGDITPTCQPQSGSTFAHGTTTVNCRAKDHSQNLSEASFDVTVENARPTADNQSVSLDEDTTLLITLTGGDVDDYPVSPITFSVVSGPSNGSLTGTEPDVTYEPDPDWFGSDSFTFKTSDGDLESEIATVSITVDPVNDAPVISIDRVTADVQYSDTIGTVNITATDIDDDPLTLSSEWTLNAGASNAGLPSGLSTSGGCTTTTYGTSAADGTDCAWTLSGPMLEPSGDYDITFTVTDAGGGTAVILDRSGATELLVSPENASIAFDGANPVSEQVTGDGSDASLPFTLVFTVRETFPDSATFSPMAGDISNAIPETSIQLTPVGPGSTQHPVGCATSDNGLSGYAKVISFECDFDAVPVNTYSVDVAINGGHYTGSSDDVFTVFDPSLGYTTGGGWFYWPGTTDKTNFGYTMKYNSRRTNIRGSFMLIRHIEGAPEGEDKWRLKSNALEGLALGTDGDYSWAAINGRATYLAPGADTLGNHEFTLYVEDRAQPGAGMDNVWLQTRDRDDLEIPDLSMDEPAVDNTQTIEGGNIFVPHQGSR